MVLIVDDDRTKRSKDIKADLEQRGIASVICDIDHIKKYPDALLVFTFAPSEYRLNIIGVRSGSIPVIAVNESGSRIYNKDVRFYDPDGNGSVVDFIYDHIVEQQGVAPLNCTVGALVIENKIVSYGVARIKLTPSERRILLLLILCKGKWVSENTIVHACFGKIGKPSSTKVPVHICNLNKKAHDITGKKFITAKRGVGYTLAKNL